MARPKKAPDELRNDRLPNVRVTAAERNYVEGEAAKAGLPLVEFCRRAILKIRITPPPSKIEADTLAELNRIGVNLNQIARGVNEARGLPHDFREVMGNLDAVLRKIAGGL